MRKIFFIHKGNSEYVSKCLKKCRELYDSDEIVLLGDKLNSSYPYIRHELIENYSQAANEFEKIYKHLSPNNLQYELFCFSRWFILKEYMQKNNINEGCYLDTDIMILDRIPLDLYDGKFNYTYDSGHSSIFNLERLNDLCNYISDYYGNEDKLNELEKIYKLKIDNNINEGISDMTLISLFAFENPDICRDLSIVNRGHIFDHNINCADGYESIYGKKKVYSIQNELYVKNLKLNKLIKVITLHFQGRAKIYMDKFSDISDYHNCFFDYSQNKWIDISDSSSGKKKNSISIKIKELSYKIKDKIYLNKNKVYNQK